MRVLIDPGIMPPARMVDLASRATNNVSFITEDVSLREDYLRLDPTVSMARYPRMHDRRPREDAGRSLRADSVKIWQKVIDDHQTMMIFDRTTRVPLSSSLKIALIIGQVVRCQAYLETARPDLLVYMATPHNITTWIFARVAEELGTRVRYFQLTLLPWRLALMEGMRRDAALVPPPSAAVSATEELLASDYAERKKGSFDQAYPQYEKDRLKRNRGRHYSLSADLLRSWRRPDLILNKALCYRTYTELARAPSPGDSYVILFLHFQPERTTLPEAYGFAQQLAAIIALAAALPEGTRLYVKEHPSTFTQDCLWKERLPFWYRRIAAMENVQLIPIEADPYRLIENSICVSTIAGTVAGEALVRGKPVVAFGRGAITLVQTDGLHRYADQLALREFFAGFGTRPMNSFHLLEYFYSVAERTYSGDGGHSNFDAIQSNLTSIRFAAMASAFADMMGVTSVGELKPEASVAC
jgi:hypothetical protein